MKSKSKKNWKPRFRTEVNMCQSAHKSDKRYSRKIKHKNNENNV